MVSLLDDSEAVVPQMFEQIDGHAMIDHDGAAHHLPILEGDNADIAGFVCVCRYGSDGDHAAVIGKPKIGFIFRNVLLTLHFADHIAFLSIIVVVLVENVNVAGQFCHGSTWTFSSIHS